MPCEKIHVSTGKPYDLLIGRGILNGIGNYVRELFRGCKAVIVTDSNVEPLYGDTVFKSLTAAGFETRAFTFNAGEPSKSHAVLLSLYSFLAGFEMTRRDIIVALGGGVTGDLAGFAAATYMRGIDFIQVPTTLLAQVDSSIGGKTAVDIKEGKNLVGAFHQPRLVVCDPDVLSTLDPRIYADGMGEVIKHACIRDENMFNMLAGGTLSGGDLIIRNMNIKRQVVEHDEQEHGERMVLNFGHTLGHAIEAYYHFNGISHGEAVGIGMVEISRAGERVGLTRPGTSERIAGLLQKYGLPTRTAAPLPEIARGAVTDKKRDGGNLNLVFLKQIGEGFIYKMPVTRFIALFQEEENLCQR